MRHLVCARLHESRRCGGRDIVTAGGVFCQSVEPVDEPQHMRHSTDEGDWSGAATLRYLGLNIYLTFLFVKAFR
jgi:hypothetical protein